MDTFEKVKEMIAKQLKLDVSEINENSLLVDDLDADSLDFIELAMDFEDAFGITVADDDVQTLHTVGDVVKYLEERK